jgi:hypothetical protein
MVDEVAANGLLTPEQAFRVMSEYVWQFHEAFGDDLLQLVSDTGIGEVWSDARPTDPAAMRDWLRCVDWVACGGAPRSRGLLTDPD